MHSTVPVRVLELRSVRGTGGGPEKTIILGTKRTDTRRFDITVCYLRDARDHVFAVDEQARHLGPRYTEIVERQSFDPRIWKAVKALVADRRIDIVHSHDYKTDLLAWLLWHRCSTIPLATAHGWTGHSTRERRVYYPVDRWLLARFPRVIAVANDVRRDLLRAGASPDRVTVVLNGIDPDRFRRAPENVEPARRLLGVTPTDVVIGSVGRLEPQKRFDLLIRAVAALPTDLLGRTARLVIAGDGSQREGLQQLASSLSLGDRCLFLGHRTDIAALHHAFDLYVQSSDYEGTPNAVLEAMAFETPLIATVAGGTAELVRDGLDGLLVPVGDANALAAAINKALTGPAATARRVASGRRRVETDLSFDTRMRKVEAVYTDLMNGRNIRMRGRSGNGQL